MSTSNQLIDQTRISEVDSVALYVNRKKIPLERIGEDSLDIRIGKNLKGEKINYGIFAYPPEIIAMLLERDLEKTVTWKPKYTPPKDDVIFALERKNVEKEVSPDEYEIEIQDPNSFVDFLKIKPCKAAEFIYESIKKHEKEDIEEIYFEVKRARNSEKMQESKIFF